MSGPLAGIRIVEMAGIGPGPFCAMMLADMGAEVIRVQAKGQRPLFPFLNTPADVLARGRRSLAVDLKAPGGTEVVLALIERADGLIEGFRPGVMERLGLGPEICAARRPALVFGRMTGWGQTGPWAQAAGHDINYIALSGALAAMGPAGAPPAVPLNLVGDFGGGGMLLAFGMVCALLEARQSGKGQVVDAAMTDGSALLASMFYGLKAAGAWTGPRGANLLDGGAPFYANYECADGRFLAVGAIEPAFYRQFLTLLGLGDVEPAAQMSVAAWPSLKERIAATLRKRTRDQWCSVFDGTDACVAPIVDWDEAPAHPQNSERDAFVDVAGVLQPAPAPRFSRTPGQVSAPPARADQHTEQILADWEIDPALASTARSHGALG